MLLYKRGLGLGSYTVMPETNQRPGFGLGFGLTGLLSAAAAYVAYDYGAFSGPPWRAALAAIVIGTASAVLMVNLDKWLRRPRKPGPEGNVRLKGPWACPRCGAAYVPEATHCSDCEVPLVGTRS